MIWINVKFTVKPEFVDRWLDATREYTEATRAETGNLWFFWTRSVDRDDTFLLCEGFADDGAAAHVNSDHFTAGIATMRPMLVTTPDIISRQVDGEGWDKMGEMQVG
ncbi:putative quinol monooxygenase [Dietzia sp. PP-33]|jgi:quinol monooxygenase YgiN|uniref:putative quinol monooxygenase n=1 Tax=Dietzia sp. PP-33 TaxID=2957500 RepID=UPI0029BD3181|nr:putative quinol monooxygenase [Dietzia sp. PP-33]MDX2357829.1 antibiotic biosynthesis monooxygenase [Dietzia sp. PP-33]